MIDNGFAEPLTCVQVSEVVLVPLVWNNAAHSVKIIVKTVGKNLLKNHGANCKQIMKTKYLFADVFVHILMFLYFQDKKMKQLETASKT